MNDLADDEEAAILENLAGGVGKIDGAFDAVTKTELLRQPHGDVAATQDAARAPDLVHDVAAVMRFDLLLHGRHHLRRAQVHFLARRRAAGDEIGRSWRLAIDFPIRAAPFSGRPVIHRTI